VNGPEVLHLIRGELQQAVGRQGKPPSPRPMNVSPWLAMNASAEGSRTWRSARRQPCSGTPQKSSGGGLDASRSRTSGSQAWRLWGSQRWRWEESKLARRWGAGGGSPAALSRNFAGLRGGEPPTLF